MFKAERNAEQFALYARKAELAAREAGLKQALKRSQLASFREEARCRSAVLRKLGHINEEGVVQLKGRAACEVGRAGGNSTAAGLGC